MRINGKKGNLLPQPVRKRVLFLAAQGSRLQITVEKEPCSKGLDAGAILRITDEMLEIAQPFSDRELPAQDLHVGNVDEAERIARRGEYDIPEMKGAEKNPRFMKPGQIGGKMADQALPPAIRGQSFPQGAPRQGTVKNEMLPERRAEKQLPDLDRFDPELGQTAGVALKAEGVRSQDVGAENTPPAKNFQKQAIGPFDNLGTSAVPVYNPPLRHQPPVFFHPEIIHGAVGAETGSLPAAGRSCE